jgi:DNA-directed RNA polymerase subunit RPC12/RpoP
VSDARPITNVTDFVCSSCWQSFGKHDPGVVQGSRIVCPHCGHVLPSDASDLTAAVRGAGGHRSGSDGFTPGEFAERTLTEQPSSLEAMEAALGKRGFVPPDLSSPSAPGGFVVGDVEDDFDFEEKTLRPDQNIGSLLDAVRETSDDNLINPPLATQTSPDKGTEADLASVELADSDWKLKSMGLVYNFHGLEALLAWAGNKAGQTLSISADGNVWRDFGSFFELYRSGTPIAAALAGAAEPGSAGALAVTTISKTQTPKVDPKAVGKSSRPEAPELSANSGKVKAISPFDKANVMTSQDLQNNGGRAAPGTRTPGGGRVSDIARPEQPARGGAPLGGHSRPSQSNRPIGQGSRSGSQPRGMPPQAEEKTNPNTFIVLLVILVLLGGVAGLHLSGIFKLPFLP